MSPLFDYAVTSLIWAAAGLVIGFAFGRLTRTVDRMAANVETITDAVTEEGRAVTTKRRRRRPSYEQTIGAVVVLLGLFTAAQGLYQDSATRRVAECVQAYSNGFADAIDQRSAANAERDAAFDSLITTVAESTAASEDPGAAQRFRDALAQYLEKRAQQRATAERNPFPPAPRDVCG